MERKRQSRHVPYFLDRYDVKVEKGTAASITASAVSGTLVRLLRLVSK